MKKYKSIFKENQINKKVWDKWARDKYIELSKQNFNNLSQEDMETFALLTQMFKAIWSVPTPDLVNTNQSKTPILNKGDVIHTLFGILYSGNLKIKQFVGDSYIIVSDIDESGKKYIFNKSNKNKKTLGKPFVYKWTDIDDTIKQKEGKQLEII